MLYKAPFKTIKGFTLVELSIVIVIIGLVIAGVTAGKTLVRQAQFRSVITQIGTYRQAYNTFRLQYNAIAGDMIKASSYWTGISNGNGNGLIDGAHQCLSNPEGLLFWQQMGLSGLVPGSFNGTTAGSDPRCAIGVNVPGGAISGSFFYPWSNVGGSIYNKRIGNYLHLGKWDTDSSAMGAIATSAEGKNFDTKIDDGIANKGKVFGIDGNSTTSTNVGACSPIANPGSDYNLSSTIISCRFFIDFN